MSTVGRTCSPVTIVDDGCSTTVIQPSFVSRDVRESCFRTTPMSARPWASALGTEVVGARY